MEPFMKKKYVKEELETKRFGKWKVLEYLGVNNRDSECLCQCECGLIKRVKTYHLVNGYSSQCIKCGQKPRKYKDGIGQAIWNIIVRRSDVKKIDLSISKEYAYSLYLKQDKKCALTGLDIRLPECGTDYLKKDWSASLDRIDSSIGYIEGNVQWVHKDINRMKNIYSQDYFIYMCEKVFRYNN
jgi:hypothetical protein